MVRQETVIAAIGELLRREKSPLIVQRGEDSDHAYRLTLRPHPHLVEGMLVYPSEALLKALVDEAAVFGYKLHLNNTQTVFWFEVDLDAQCEECGRKSDLDVTHHGHTRRLLCSYCRED